MKKALIAVTGYLQSKKIYQTLEKLGYEIVYLEEFLQDARIRIEQFNLIIVNPNYKVGLYQSFGVDTRKNGQIKYTGFLMMMAAVANKAKLVLVRDKSKFNKDMEESLFRCARNWWLGFEYQWIDAKFTTKEIEELAKNIPIKHDPDQKIEEIGLQE